MNAAGPAPGRDLPSLALDMEAADRAMTCGGIGLRAYAEASGLDPAADFRGLDLRGWELDGQDLRGFDLTGCDLRASGIESALVDGSTRLEGAVWDEGAEPGSRHERPALTHADLARIARTAGELYDRYESKELAAAGRFLLPLLESIFDSDDERLLLISGYVAFGELREGNPSVARVRLASVVDRERAAGRTERSPRHLTWRFFMAEALIALDRPGEALAECDAVLPLYEAVHGVRSANTFGLRNLRAEALLELGQAEGALREFDALAPLIAAICGALDPSALVTRHDKGRALLDLNRANEALAAFDELLPSYEAVRGADHLNTLTVRFYRARALLALSRAGEAWADLNSILPLCEVHHGSAHVYSLHIRLHRALALLDLSRAEEARTELRAVLEGYKAAKGEDHWWVSAARSEEIGALMALGGRGFAAELAAIVDHVARERYPTSDSVLRARHRLVRDLIATGAIDRARAEAAVVSALSADATVSRHRYVRATLDLVAGLDGEATAGASVF